MSRKYTETERNELMERVIARVSEQTTPLACRDVGVPETTFRRWVVEASADVAERYTRARTLFAEKLAAEVLSISDEDVGRTINGATDPGAVNRNRLRVDSRKWLLSKLFPKRYGDRLTVAGDEDSPVTIQKVERIIVDQRKRNNEGLLDYDEEEEQ